MPHAAPHQPGLFGNDPVAIADTALVAAYVHAGRTLDDLPYTPEFDAIYLQAGAGKSRWDVLHTLQNIRKANKLPKLGKAASPSIKVTADEEHLLKTLVEKHAGSLGQRDRLLYAPEFDALVHEFNAKAARSLTPHDLWRLVAKLAK